MRLSNFVADGQKVVGFDPFARLADWLEAEAKIVNDRRAGVPELAGQDANAIWFWLPVFGGWLRNVDDEQMEASWEYVRDLTLRAEKIGYDLTLIAELI